MKLTPPVELLFGRRNNIRLGHSCVPTAKNTINKTHLITPYTSRPSVSLDAACRIYSRVPLASLCCYPGWSQLRSHKVTDIEGRDRILCHQSNGTFLLCLLENEIRVSPQPHNGILPFRTILSGRTIRELCHWYNSHWQSDRSLEAESESDICYCDRSNYAACHCVYLIMRTWSIMQTSLSSSWRKKDCELWLGGGATPEKSRALQSRSQWCWDYMQGQTVFTLWDNVWNGYQVLS